MVQASFFVALTAILSIVQALPVAVDIEARDESDSVLEARMFRKIATEVGYVDTNSCIILETNSFVAKKSTNKLEMPSYTVDPAS